MDRIEWDKLTPGERNRVVLSYLPQPPHAPLREWGVECDGQFHRILVQSDEEAGRIIDILNAAKERELKKLGWPVAWRGRMKLGKREWALRYSDTAGGAWEVVDQLIKDGYDFRACRTAARTIVSISRSGRADQSVTALGDNFANATCVLFLRTKGLTVKWSNEILERSAA